MEKNFPSKRKSFGMKREDFRQRQKHALSKRLFNGGGLNAKILAHALGVHGDTVLNWAHGYSTMDGAAIEAVDNFFASTGDWGFIAEIYGEIGVRRRQRAMQLQRQAEQLMQQAEWLEAEGAAA